MMRGEVRLSLLSAVLVFTFFLIPGCASQDKYRLALFVNYFHGYTINRITLFALILSLGLVVDVPLPTWTIFSAIFSRVALNRCSQQSHAIVLRLRENLEDIARRYGADLKIVEVPPGPPVLSTIVAEIYGPPDRSYDYLIGGARHVKEKIMAREPFVTDIDDSVETPRTKVDFILD